MLDFFTHCCLTKFDRLLLELNINSPVSQVEIITLIYSGIRIHIQNIHKKENIFF